MSSRSINFKKDKTCSIEYVLVLILILVNSLSFANDNKLNAYNNLSRASQLISNNYCRPCEESKWQSSNHSDARFEPLDIYDAENTAPKYTHAVDIEVVVFEGSDWEIEEVRQAYKKAAAVFNQCDIMLNVTAIKTRSPLPLGRTDIHYDLAAHDGDMHGIVSDLPAASDKVLRDLRVRSFSDGNTAVAASNLSSAYANPDILKGHKIKKGYIYKNEVWVSTAVKEEEQDRPYPRFSTVAHEIAHVLLNCVEQTEDNEVPAEFACRPFNDTRPNLMNNAFNYMSEHLVTKGPGNQCDRMKNKYLDSYGLKFNKMIREL